MTLDATSRRRQSQLAPRCVQGESTSRSASPSASPSASRSTPRLRWTGALLCVLLTASFAGAQDGAQDEQSSPPPPPPPPQVELWSEQASEDSAEESAEEPPESATETGEGYGDGSASGDESYDDESYDDEPYGDEAYGDENSGTYGDGSSDGSTSGDSISGDLGDFDFEAARRQVAADMVATPNSIPVDQAVDVVDPEDLDEDLGAISLRGAGEQHLDLRSVERLRWECRNEVGRREVTLFGNGTVRLRTGLWSDLDMRLDELTHETLLGYLSRLARVQRSEALRFELAGEERFGAVDGRWTEACLLSLDLPDLPSVSMWTPRLEVPSLGVGQLVQIADELASFTRPIAEPTRMPATYVPRPGDILQRDDARLFRVVDLTTDGGGVELESLHEPVRIFYLLEDVPRLFEPVRDDAAELLDEPPEVAREPDVRDLDEPLVEPPP